MQKKRKNLNNSLTLRIFCITFAMLLGAGAVTYGLVAMAAPITYISIVSGNLQDASLELSFRLQSVPLEESGPIIDQFILETGAGVLIMGEDGSVVETSSHLSFQVAYEGDTAIVTVSPSSDAVTSVTVRDSPFFGWKFAGSLEKIIGMFQEQDSAVMSSVSGYTITTDQLEYPFSCPGDPQRYTLRVTPPVEKTNHTLEALNKAAPLVLGVMLVFSALCARGYSQYITRPILRLSEISQRMAYLDFSWRCQETRGDEIGVLGRSLDELSGRLSAALQELKAANAALERDIQRERELERQRTAFFSAASHELKTPVTILKGQLTGMLEGVDVYQDRDLYLAKALRTAGRMEALVQELLTVSRMESAAPEWQAVDLSALVREQAAFAEDLLADKAVFLNLPDGLTVSGDPALLRKVLENLLSNAAFYSPPGASVSLSAGKTSDAVVLLAENSGARIPADALPRLFDAFYRVESSRNRRTGGSGLGLYIVRMILGLHGAECFAENTRSGVRFTVRFPLQGSVCPSLPAERTGAP